MCSVVFLAFKLKLHIQTFLWRLHTLFSGVPHNFSITSTPLGTLGVRSGGHEPTSLVLTAWIVHFESMVTMWTEHDPCQCSVNMLYLGGWARDLKNSRKLDSSSKANVQCGLKHTWKTGKVTEPRYQIVLTSNSSSLPNVIQFSISYSAESFLI